MRRTSSRCHFSTVSGCTRSTARANSARGLVVSRLSLVAGLGYRPEEFARTLDLVARQEIDAGTFISGVVNLEDFGTAFEQLRQPDNHLKLLIRP